MASDQVRGVDPDTGGEKGLKLASIGDACPKALMEIAKVYGHGRKKYSRGNYLSGYTWSCHTTLYSGTYCSFGPGRNATAKA